MRKGRVAIIGTGNIGSDLLVKILRSPILECSYFIGRNYNSKGMQFASQFNIPLSDKSINTIIENPECCDIVMDCTSAAVHNYNAPLLRKLGKFVIDLTPSQIGEMCIPALNGNQCLNAWNINLITCGGQATVPIAYAIKEACDKIDYFEMVSVISSKSAGPGTRDNIDEFTQTTKKALNNFTGVNNAKAIITLNPAEPPILMHNTLYTIAKAYNLESIRESVKKMEDKIRSYVPGYKITIPPTEESGRLVTMVTVTGLGDYLPPYSGNLDIITCAAVKMAEEFSIKKLS